MREFAAFIITFVLFVSACQRSVAINEPGGAIEAREIRISAPGVNASEPAISSDLAGNVYLAYVEHVSKDVSDVYLQRLESDGSLAGEKVRVNPAPGEAKAWYGDPPTIYANDEGKIYIGWTAKDGEKGTTLYLSVSQDGGRSFDPPVKVNDDTKPASHGMHSLAVRGENVYLAWLDERNVDYHGMASTGDQIEHVTEPGGYRFIRADHGPHPKPKNNEEKKTHEMGAEPNSEVFFAVSTDGGKTFSSNKKLAGEVCPCCKTSITTSTDGKLYVSWRQVLDNGCRHVAVLSSPDGGQTFGERRIVSDDNWEISACPVSGAAMSVDSAGVLKIAWYTAGDAGQPGLYSTSSSDTGNSFGQRLLVSNAASVGTPVLVAAAGDQYTIFAASGTVEIKPTAGGRPHKIADALYPAAAYAGNNLLVSFVRGDAPDTSIYLAALPIK